MSQEYVLLDRDGVINEDSDDYIKTPEEWIALPKSLEAIALFNRHDYKVIVITNQSGIGRGFYSEETLTKMHEKMHRLVKEKNGVIDDIYICPHTPDDNCLCRKPKPGLLTAFAKEKSISLSNVYFIGDKLSDIQAANAAGAKPILVKTGKGQRTINSHPNIDIPIFENLYDAASFITQYK